MVRTRQFQLGFIGVVEQGHDREILVVGHRIKFVGVALGALQGEAQPRGAGGGHPVHHGMIAEFQRIDAAFLVQHRVPVEPGGDELVGGGIGEEIARNLFDCELVEGQVGVERADDPVAPGPDGAAAVLFITIGVRITGQIEPLPSPSLAIMRRGQQAVHGMFIGLRGRVGERGGQFCSGGGEAGQVEADAPEQGGLAGFR